VQTQHLPPVVPRKRPRRTKRIRSTHLPKTGPLSWRSALLNRLARPPGITLFAPSDPGQACRARTAEQVRRGSLWTLGASRRCERPNSWRSPNADGARDGYRDRAISQRRTRRGQRRAHTNAIRHNLTPRGGAECPCRRDRADAPRRLATSSTPARACSPRPARSTSAHISLAIGMENCLSLTCGCQVPVTHA
jgi:hypothetical protein